MFTFPEIMSQVEETKSEPSSKIFVLGMPPVAIIIMFGFSDRIFYIVARQL